MLIRRVFVVGEGQNQAGLEEESRTHGDILQVDKDDDDNDDDDGDDGADNDDDGGRAGLWTVTAT